MTGKTHLNLGVALALAAGLAFVSSCGQSTPDKAPGPSGTPAGKPPATVPAPAPAPKPPDPGTTTPEPKPPVADPTAPKPQPPAADQPPAVSPAAPAKAGKETVWIEDGLPAGAAEQADGEDAWTWVTENPAPQSGKKAHQSNAADGEHQHFFTGATETLEVKAGDKLFTWVWLDAANPPKEVMLQWHENESWEHRAYWGENSIDWGADGTESRQSLGALPAAGKWVRLEVPAAKVGLEGRTLDGMAFTLFGGKAAWDCAGKAAGQ